MSITGAFWAAIRGFQMNTHQMDTILAQETTTIQDVLNEESLIQEVRNQSQNLFNFLTPERIEYLIDLITIYPDPEEDIKRIHNHPFIASEVMNEPSQIHDKILQHPELQTRLFQFLDSSYLHPTLSGYFSNAVQSLITRNPEKAISVLIELNVLDKLLVHFYSKSVADIVVKVLTIEYPSVEKLFIQERAVVVSMVISKVSDNNEHCSMLAGAVLNEVINKSIESSVVREIASRLYEKESLEVLFNVLTSANTAQAVSAAGVIKTSLLHYTQNPIFSAVFNKEIFVEVLSANLPQLSQRLLVNNPQTVLTTFSHEVPVLGELRLKIIELISLSVKAEIEELETPIIQSNIFLNISTIFFSFPWHSLLHNTIESLISVILRKDSRLLDAILVQSGFLNRLLQTSEQPKELGTHRFGNLGQIHKIGNALKLSEISSIKEILSKFSNWDYFSSTYLPMRNNIENIQLGEIKKIESSSSDYDFSESYKDFTQDSLASHVLAATEKKMNEFCNKETLAGSTETHDKKIVFDENKVPGVYNRPVSPKISSPMSPLSDSQYNTVNYWSLGLQVDEIEELE